MRRYLGSRSAGVDDVAQEVFVRIYRSKHTYEPNAKVGTWIYRITVNTCLNEIRTPRRRQEPARGRASPPSSATTTGRGGLGGARSPTAPRRGPDPRIEADELEARVREAVDALPEQQRLAVVLSRYHGLPYEEVAAAMESTSPR